MPHTNTSWRKEHKNYVAQKQAATKAASLCAHIRFCVFRVWSCVVTYFLRRSENVEKHISDEKLLKQNQEKSSQSEF